MRMSDMNDIKSCHSRTGGYFQCAVAESRGQGPIAYLVPREQFEQYFDVDLNETNPEDVDLDQGGEEIFEDDARFDLPINKSAFFSFAILCYLNGYLNYLAYFQSLDLVLFC